MRPHWKTASPIVQRTVEQWLGGEGSAPETWLAAASAAFSMGFTTDAPPTPTLHEMDKLTASGDTAGATRILCTRRNAIDHERAAQRYWDSLSAWRETKPNGGAQAAQ